MGLVLHKQISKWTITRQRSFLIVLLFLTASSENRCYGNVRFAIRYSPVFSELTEHDG